MRARRSTIAVRSPQLRTDKQSEVMLDPLAQQVGIGGAVAVLLVSAVLRFLPSFLSAMKRNGNGKAAGLTAQEWRAEIEAAAERALVKGAAQRNADVEKLME